MDYRLPANSGLVSNPFDARDVWLDELVGGEVTLPQEYITNSLTFEPQGSFPFCASFCVTKMVENALQKKHHVHYELSQPHLFYNSGGSPIGSTFRGNLDTARERGCVPYASCPMPDDIWNGSFDALKKTALSVPFGDSQKIIGYARVQPDRDELKKALLSHELVLVGVCASGGWWKDRTPRSKPVDNHAVLLCGWDSDDSWVVFDSLQPEKDFSGYHRLSKDYGFTSAYVVTELPADWKDKRDEARKAPQGNLERYGKPRDYQAEVMFANKMLEEFKRFNNQSVLEAAGRFWETLIRCGVYGNYSLSYTKWGRWMPGDILNTVYNWRRTGKHLFDFNKLRNEQ